MSAFSHAAGAGLLLLGTLLAVALGGWQFGLGDWYLEERRTQRLEEEGVACRRVTTEKDRTAEDLIGRRITLAQAAARFRRLSAETPAHGGDPLANYPGATKGEKGMRQVISWACDRMLSDRPEEAKAVRSRLEEELRRLLERDAKTHPSAL